VRGTILLVAGALAMGALYAPQRVVPEAAMAAEETPADWEKKYDSTLDRAVKELEKLAKWCEREHLEWTANYVRRKGFQFRPDDEKLRAYFGYEKWEDGRWRQNDLKRDEFRSIIDEDDPNSGKFPENMAKANTKIAGWFKGLASKAKKMHEDSGDAAWQPLAARAWEMVLMVDPEGKYAKQAHVALEHPKFDGEYVSPFKLKFLENRKARKQAGEAEAAKSYAVEQIPADGNIPGAGLEGWGAKGELLSINTTHNQEVTDRLVVWAHRGVHDIVDIYGFPEAVLERLPLRKMDIVKRGDNKAELKQYLEKGAKWDQARITKYTEHFGGMGGVGPGCYVSMNGPDADADDSVMHRFGHAAVRAAHSMALSDLGARLGSMSNSVENWLTESIAYDCTRRLTGNTLTTCGEFGRYGNNMAPKPGQDLWIQLARRQVEMDDDVELSRLWKLTLTEIKGPETVKGYALIQFLFEHDTALAQKFIWHALAHGTPAAVVDVYGDWLGTPKPKEEDATAETYAKGAFNQPEYLAAMAALDDRYREWIMKSW
jgi:hypothetical protein